MADVTLRKVIKRYDEVEAVRGIDLDIADHEFVVLVGPSGCGKSTTLRMIAGLEDITGGTLEADLTVTKLADEKFWVVASDTAHGHAETWMHRHIAADAHAFVTDVTSAYARDQHPGPAFTRVDADGHLGRHVERRVSVPDRAREIDIGFARALCIRITYLGELGYELYIPAEQATHVYDRLVEAGREVDLVHAGLKALASLRMEKGYRDYGHDIDNTDSVLEAGLGFAVDLDKPGGFLGRDAVLAKKARGSTDAPDPADPRAGPRSVDVPRRDRAPQRHTRRLRARRLVRLHTRRRGRLGDGGSGRTGESGVRRRRPVGRRDRGREVSGSRVRSVPSTTRRWSGSRADGRRSRAHREESEPTRPSSAQVGRCSSSMTPISVRKVVSFASPATIVVEWCGLARAASRPPLDAEMLVHRGIDAQVGDDRRRAPGAASAIDAPVGFVERRHDLREIRLREADVARLFEHVQLRHRARDRVHALVAHRRAVHVVEQLLDREDQEVRHRSRPGAASSSESECARERRTVRRGAGAADVLAEHHRVPALVGDLDEQVAVRRDR